MMNNLQLRKNNKTYNNKNQISQVIPKTKMKKKN